MQEPGQWVSSEVSGPARIVKRQTLKWRCVVQVMATATEEINVAHFHPSPHIGIVYGTRYGAVRMLANDCTLPPTSSA